MDRRILVVDDNELVCEQLSQLLARPERRIKVAHDGTTALEWLIERNFSVVLTDLCLPGNRRPRPDPRDPPSRPSGHRDRDDRARLDRLGRRGHEARVPTTTWSSPSIRSRLEFLVQKALEDRKLQDEVRSLRQGLHERVLVSQPLRQEPQDARGLRPRGESLSNKLHRPDHWRDRDGQGAGRPSDPLQRRDPPRAVDRRQLRGDPRAAAGERVLRSREGAFTGADRQRKGRFEQAAGGTMLLDEIGSLPMAMQAKLLRVLQDGTFERVGGGEMIQADARILASTNVDLAEAVAVGKFREDLYYRLNVVSIELPPLRERIEDLPYWSTTSSGQLRERRFPSKTISRETLSRMARYEWPGNVRELEHVVEQMVVTTPGPEIEPDNLPPQIVSTREEPFSPRLRPAPAAPGHHRRVDRADRAGLPPEGSGTLPRPDRPMRRALRSVEAEHLREAPPVQHRQGRVQAPPCRSAEQRGGR